MLGYLDGSKRRVIVLCPRLEEWIYGRAAACGIDPQIYRLPSSAQDLKKIPHYETKRQFGEYLQELCQSDEEMAVLRNWLREFVV
ncbi:MAG: hypothetical protein ACPL7K_04085 [Armatimonadota bacterium]